MFIGDIVYKCPSTLKVDIPVVALVQNRSEILVKNA